jgi:hypothetical protein
MVWNHWIHRQPSDISIQPATMGPVPVPAMAKRE